jgi:putative phosphotransacetylase
MSTECNFYNVTVGVSARHLHLSKEDLEKLFGKGYELTPVKDLSQPGQFASDERVNIVGPKGRIDNIRILGPIRKKTQVEIAKTDSFRLGVNPPVRDSGDIKGSPGITIEGPKGSIEIEEGVICALRHIHMTPEDAQKYGCHDKEMVKVKVEGDRALIFEEVIIRVREDFALDFHIDTDEANAADLKNGDIVKFFKA